MKTVLSRCAAGVLAIGLSAGLTACGGSDTAADDGPVTLEMWSDKAGAETAVKAFNDAHEDVTIKLVKVPGVDQVNKLTNTNEAGDSAKAACLAASDNRQGGGLLAQGVLSDISKELEASKDKFAPGAIEALTLAGAVYGVPVQRQPIFTVAYTPAFEKAGLEVPTSWEEMIETGKKLRKQGVHIFNLAGEDPSTFMFTAWQGGARWYSVEGDSWKVDFTDPASLKAADVFQQLLDNDLVETISYADYAAMMQEYDSGKIVMRQVSTWQLASHQQNMKDSPGKWAPKPNLGVAAGDKPVSASDTLDLAVPSLCEHKKEAVEAAVWLATSGDPIKAMADPTKGSGWYPAVKDPSPYLDAVVPHTLFGDNADQAVPMIKESSEFASGWVYGPNSTAMYEELADQWGKAMNGDIKLKDALAHMQKWTVADLKKSGINVVE